MIETRAGSVDYPDPMDSMGSGDMEGVAGDALLQALLAGVTDGVVIADDHGEIVAASRSMERLVGWTSSELVGRNVRLLVPEPHQARHDEYLSRYRETGHTWIMDTVREFDVMTSSGGTVPCELCVSRFDGPSARRKTLLCGVFRDVSERVRARERLEASEAKFRAVFENENQLVMLLDDSGRIIEANQPTYRRTGAVPENLIGRVLDECRLWGDERANRDAVARVLAEAYERGLATTRASVDVLTRDASGPRLRPRPHEVSVRTLEGGRAPRAIVEVRDISALVEAEDRERAIERSLAQIGEESAVLAHELRSPVSELELALKALARQLGAEERSLLENLARRMRRLEALLKRTLGFSKPLKLIPEAVGVLDALHEAAENESATLRRCGTRMEVVPNGAVGLEIEADRASLLDALGNLVRNAAEAQTESPGGGKVRLTADRGAPGRAILVVEDEGPGIPAERHSDVFRVFHTDKAEGTGFGLPLVQKIAESHGATVRLTRPASGTGLRVELDWPLAQ